MKDEDKRRVFTLLLDTRPRLTPAAPAPTTALVPPVPCHLALYTGGVVDDLQMLAKRLQRGDLGPSTRYEGRAICQN